jgi:hypothetical protein
LKKVSDVRSGVRSSTEHKHNASGGRMASSRAGRGREQKQTEVEQFPFFNIRTLYVYLNICVFAHRIKSSYEMLWILGVVEQCM